MPTADLAPLGSQQASQHPRAGEWELQVQLIETPHDREVGGRHGAWQIINAATADLQNLRLLRDRFIAKIRAMDSALDEATRDLREIHNDMARPRNLGARTA